MESAVYKQLQKNQDYIARIDGYSSDGSGVCRISGRAVFVRGAIPGETWDIKILKVTAGAVYAKGVSLIEASPERREPDCPHFGKCGGCDLRHMSYGEELRFKLQRLNDALSRIGGLDLKAEEIIGADEISGYRNKAIYAVGESEGVPVTGFYHPRSHDIIPVKKCAIQHEFSDRAAEAVRLWMERCGVPAYDESSGEGVIRRIFTRYGFSTFEAQVCVVSAVRPGCTSELVSVLREKCPELSSVVLNINKSLGNTVLSGDYHTLWGRPSIEDRLCSLGFELSPGSFYQINPRQAERLYALARQYAGQSGTALDLYCGTGTISLFLASSFGRVIGAEAAESAVRDARRNAMRNQIGNAEFICADAALAARELSHRGLRPDAVIVDPPRKGLSDGVIREITAMSPERVVYVSCDPGTLARDLKKFVREGYLAIKAEAVDMFPRTKHVETVVLLSKLKSTTSIEVKIDLDEMDLTKS